MRRASGHPVFSTAAARDEALDSRLRGNARLLFTQARSPPLQRLDDFRGVVGIPVDGAGDDAEFAAVLVDQQAGGQAERLAGDAQALEGIGARVGVARQRFDADPIEKGASADRAAPCRR